MHYLTSDANNDIIGSSLLTSTFGYEWAVNALSMTDNIYSTFNNFSNPSWTEYQLRLKYSTYGALFTNYLLSNTWPGELSSSTIESDLSSYTFFSSVYAIRTEFDTTTYDNVTCQDSDNTGAQLTASYNYINSTLVDCVIISYQDITPNQTQNDVGYSVRIQAAGGSDGRGYQISQPSSFITDCDGDDGTFHVTIPFNGTNEENEYPLCQYWDTCAYSTDGTWFDNFTTNSVTCVISQFDATFVITDTSNQYDSCQDSTHFSIDCATTMTPTIIPTTMPTTIPSKVPTVFPSMIPSQTPFRPTAIPSNVPTEIPSDTPSQVPSDAPTVIQTNPTQQPRTTSTLTTYAPFYMSTTAVTTTDSQTPPPTVLNDDVDQQNNSDDSMISYVRIPFA